MLLRGRCSVGKSHNDFVSILQTSGHYWQFAHTPSEIVFQLQPTPQDSSPTATDPPRRESNSSRFSMSFRVGLESFSSARLKIDSKIDRKTTQNRRPARGGRW